MNAIIQNIQTAFDGSSLSRSERAARRSVGDESLWAGQTLEWNESVRGPSSAHFITPPESFFTGPVGGAESVRRRRSAV